LFLSWKYGKSLPHPFFLPENRQLSVNFFAFGYFFQPRAIRNTPKTINIEGQKKWRT